MIVARKAIAIDGLLFYMSRMFLMMVVADAIPPRMGSIGIMVNLLC